MILGFRSMWGHLKYPVSRPHPSAFGISLLHQETNGSASLTMTAQCNLIEMGEPYFIV
jgi:hypothetical protein